MQERTQRRDLFTNKDADAWAEQFHMLFYVLRMTPQQIAEIDYGFEPDDPEAWAVFPWAHEINRQFPFFSVAVHLKKRGNR